MGHIIKDFFLGALIIGAAAVLGVLGFALYLLLGAFFTVFSFFAGIFLFVFLCLGLVWLVGFIYRTMREARP
jgi:hypothetical protein